MKKIISTDKSPAAIGPYSQGVLASNFLFVSGQIPMNPVTGDMVDGDIQDKFIRTIENVRGILKASGMDLINVVKVSVFLTDLNNFVPMNEAYEKVFTDKYPAREAIEVSRLPRDAEIEISCIAFKS